MTCQLVILNGTAHGQKNQNYYSEEHTYET